MLSCAMAGLYNSTCSQLLLSLLIVCFNTDTRFSCREKPQTSRNWGSNFGRPPKFRGYDLWAEVAATFVNKKKPRKRRRFPGQRLQVDFSIQEMKRSQCRFIHNRLPVFWLVSF